MDAHLQAEICGRIRKARIEAGYTQEDAAALLQVTVRAYQNYESVRVPFRRMGDIAKITHATEAWLLHGEPQLDAGRLTALEAQVEALQADQREALRLLRELHGSQPRPGREKAR